MKRVFSIVLICVVLFGCVGLGNIQALAAEEGTVKGGSFVSNQQGIRFSVYDLSSCQTISTMDMFTPSNYQVLKNIRNNTSYGWYVAKGSKFDYLYDFKYDPNVAGDIEALNIRGVGVDNGILSASDVISYIGEIENNELAQYLQPIQFNGFSWIASQSLRKFFRESDLSCLEEQVLNKLGFYALSEGKETGLEPFDSNYVLVIEPVYYFWMSTDQMRRFYFYGTQTEFAILDQKLCGIYVDVGLKIVGRGIHSVMGHLTLSAGCAAVMTEQDRIFALDGAEPNADGSYPDDVRTIEIHKSIKNVADWYNDVYTKPQFRDREWHRMANERVMNYYGVTTLKMRDLTYLTIDQATPKPVYHTGTKGIISFQTISDGERSYTPKYEEIISGGDYYGLKLVLTTLNSSTGSGRSMPDMEINSDGLPDGWNDTETAAVPKVTYIYKEFDVPKTPGVWRFKLEVYSAGSEETIYSSNTGTRKDSADACYEFEVNFENIPVSNPPDAAAGDLMPKDFSASGFDLSALTASKPATSLSWSYYEAYAHTIEGVPTVSMIEHRETADSYIKDGYAPTSYGNIPLKFKNGKLYTRSGYGIGVDVPFYDTVSSGKSTGFQNGFVLLPEYGFKNYGEKLEKVGDVFRMEQNQHSIYLEDLHNPDYSRVHFTPVWYPDGEYEIAVILLDCWTPAGQLWDHRTYTVTLNGTVYDDWYITRH